MRKEVAGQPKIASSGDDAYFFLHLSCFVCLLTMVANFLSYLSMAGACGDPYPSAAEEEEEDTVPLLKVLPRLPPLLE